MTQPQQMIRSEALQLEDVRLLRLFLAERDAGKEATITPLTPDASTRRYYRLPWKGQTAIAAIYPEPFDPATQPFLDVTELFAAAQLPTPAILAIDSARALIIQEDLGDWQLRDALAAAIEDERDRLFEDAIKIIARIQAATELSKERNSISSRLAFDTEKLQWELDYFYQHYFKNLRKLELPDDESANLRAELSEVAVELAARPRVLCHRDFHSSNIIVDRAGALHVIDYQDARMGPATYDLVSLLLDRRREAPSLAEVRERRLFFLEERRRAGLEPIDPDEFAWEFRLMTVQRCLKAAGTFSYQTAVCGRGEVYGEFIRPMLEITLQAAEWLNRFPHLQQTLKRELSV